MSGAALLTIDIGNSRIKFGLFDQDLPCSAESGLPEYQRFLAVSHTEPLPWGEIASWLPTASSPPRRALVACVYPAGINRLLAGWPPAGWPRPYVVKTAGALPLQLRVDFPDKVGIDRLLNAVAVNAIRPADQSAIIVSSGTATTVDRVAPDGAFEGGAILPGLELGAKSLHQHTAFLPQIPIADLTVANLPALGKNTPAAIRSGLLYGQVGAVRELVSRLSACDSVPPLVIVTGGSGTLLAPLLGHAVRFEPDLVLRGLVLTAAKTN